MSRYEWFDNEDCEQTFSEFCADTNDDDVFLFSIYFAKTRNIRFVEYHYALNCTKFIYHQIGSKKCSKFLALNVFLNRWTKQNCFFFCLNVCQLNQSKLFYLHHRTWMKSRSNAQNTLRTVEHVNEMKRNDRTNVKGIRYTTRSYANWNSNMSKQTVCVKPKQNFHFMPTPTNGNDWKSLSFSASPLCIRFRDVHRCVWSLPMACALSFGWVCRKHSLRTSVCPLLASDCYWNHWSALACSHLRNSAFHSIIVLSMRANCCLTCTGTRM